jgi:GNAT superfamily N-acetyltransferase
MHLTRATPSQQAARDQLTAQAWGQGLSTDGFCSRELQLRAHPFAVAALRSWWWVDDEGAPLASCETFDVEGHVGEVAGVSHLVASVFTEPRLRGQGHAQAMLRAVLEAARGPASQAFVLFSEVGAPLYAGLGFLPSPGFDVLVPARLGEALPVAGPLSSPAPMRGALALRRSPAFVDWQWERERAYARLLHREPPATSTAAWDGATIGWTAYFKLNELHVLWLDEAPPTTQRRLLAAAQHAAATSGLPTVRVWDQRDGAWAQSVSGARVVSRDDEVPMFLPLVPGVERWAPIERATWA